MPARLKPADPADVAVSLTRLAEGTGGREDLRLLTKHYLARLEAKAPGRSVEVRVPPFAAVQCIEGVRHTRGTPPAVVETDAQTWIAVASGRLAWRDAVEQGRISASGERTDLTAYLPLS